MNKLFAVVLFFVISSAVADRFAIIVAPRIPYVDYGVPSESCRLYHDLINGGMNPDNIILISSTVIANSPENPFPGDLYTDDSPDAPGVDYAHNCLEYIDYDETYFRGAFLLNLLSGNSEGMKKLTGMNEPKVLKSGPDDEVLFYLTSHGMDEEIIVGDTRVIKEDFYWALHCMNDNNKFKHLLILLETCYSGSMFRGLELEGNVFVITAADHRHESFESHCPPDDVVDGKAIGTCMSCLWDNALEWFIEGDSTHTLNELFEHTHDVVAETSKQNVSKYGVEEMGEMKIEEFVGKLPSRRPTMKSSTSVPKSEVPAHLAKWRVIRSEQNDMEANLEHYRDVIFNEAKKEVEIMRLGKLFMSEKMLEKASTTMVEEYSSTCVRTLADGLVSQCKHSLPFSMKTMNMLRSICSSQSKPSVNFEDVCL